MVGWLVWIFSVCLEMLSYNAYVFLLDLPGTGVVGVVVIVKSANLSEAEKYIEALPMEVQV